MNKSLKRAAMVVIGDEILSGRTRDKNINYIATRLDETGIDLSEVRVIGDNEALIVKTVNELRTVYDYVFTSGGIGPTHDDITAGAIAQAFAVPIKQDKRAVALMEAEWGRAHLTPPRLRMAMIPEGAELIVNPVSAAPGFRLENVYVFAGVPGIMQAMFEVVLPTIGKGALMLSETIAAAGLPESAYAESLSQLARLHDDVTFGSYPAWLPDGRFNNKIVVRSRDRGKLASAVAAVQLMALRLRDSRTE